ncbi:conoporin-Cn1-like [Watersipora subatra]|uniref:conoporin-Cn1-like n=1 Tax=Watersipora subatra TaxID=2589382 RepID=UPI00355B295D
MENFSEWPMTKPLAYPVNGQISYPPSTVLPGHREAMVAHNTPYSLGGTYGTVSWLLHSGKRVIIMWYSPGSFLFHKNKLSIGFVNRDLHYESIADEMYENSMNFTVAEYYYSANSIQRCDETFCVQGTMGTSKHAKIKLYVFPKDKNNFATNVEDYMNKLQLDDVVG